MAQIVFIIPAAALAAAVYFILAPIAQSLSFLPV